MKSNEIYLAKAGKVYGPYSDADFHQIETSGEIQKYTWLWDAKAKKWQPLDPPPLPIESTRTSQKFEKNSLEAIAFDHRAAVAGFLRSVTDLGCEICTEDHSDSPRLGENSTIQLSLLDPKSGKSVNVRARLAKIRLEKQGWTYKVRWDEIPIF